MILLELLGIDAAPGRSKYKRTGKPAGRPHEFKIKPRPNKNLWFKDDKLWYNDLNLSHNGNFKLKTTENEETVIACDNNEQMAHGWWNKKEGRGITFKKPRPMHAVVHPKMRLQDFMVARQDR